MFGDTSKYQMLVPRRFNTGPAFPANTRRSPNADSMLVHRLRRWPNIESALGERLVFAGLALYSTNIADDEHVYN